MKYLSILATAALALSSSVQGVHAADEAKPNTPPEPAKRELTPEEAKEDAELAKKYPKLPPRTAPKLLNLPHTTEPRIDIEEHLAWPKEIGDAVIALWHGNATGALAFTSDDNHWASDITRWTQFAEKYPEIGMAHCVNTNESMREGDKENWRKLLALGHEIQSHGHRHWGKGNFEGVTEADGRREYAAPVEIIEEVTGKKPRILAYGSGSGMADIAADYYIAARSTYGVPNDAATISYMGIASNTNLFLNPTAFINTLLDRETKVFGKNYYGGLTSAHFHGLPKGDWEALFEEHIVPPMKEGKLWVTTLTNVAMYGQSRDTAKLKVTKNTAKEIAFTLTDDMDDDYFDHPLTIKVRVPADWKTVTAKQNGKEVKAKLVENEGKKFALVEAIPDRGETTLTP